MDLLGLCTWIEQTPLGAVMRNSAGLFDFTETTHTLGIALVAGTIMLVDLRLLGLALKRVSITEIISRVVPLTLSGFLLMLLTGVWLFAAEAHKLYFSPLFRIKLILLALAGLNALVFHLTIYRSVAEWGENDPFPRRARLAGLFSLILWIGIIAAGRSIAYGPGYEVT